MTTTIRPGEITACRNPAGETGDAHLVFIGRIRSPWQTRSDCPRNMRQARERNPQGCHIEIDAAWRPGLTGIAAGGWVHLLYWMHEARRDLIVQLPRHRDRPAGVFALRSPVRPNPVALALVQIMAVNADDGIVQIDATDALDGTPLLDIKPHLPGVDTTSGNPD